MAKLIGERIARYAYRRWMRAGMTAWPTVRETARGLRIGRSLIEECEGDGFYSLTAYHTSPPQELAEHYVEADTPEVEKAWAAYWGSAMTSPNHPIQSDGHHRRDMQTVFAMRD